MNMSLKAHQPEPTPPPPGHLGEHGGAFWRAILVEYDTDEPDSLETLAQAALCLDRLAQIRATIDAEGVASCTKLASLELSYQRSFRMLLRELGLSVGEAEQYTRPPRPIGNRAAGRTD